MSEFEEFEKSLSPEERIEAIAAQGKLDGGEFSPEAIEEAKRIASEGGIVRGSELFPPEEDLLASLPQEPPDETTPPDETAPVFIIVKDAYGPGSPSVKFANGEPVGVWLDREHHDLSGAQVEQLLRELGLQEAFPGRPAWFGKQRDIRIREERKLHAMPLIQQAIATEQERLSHKEQVRAAFLAAQKKKAKEGK